MSDKYSDEHVRETAKGCTTYAQLHRKLGWTLFAATVQTADRLRLGMVYAKPKGGKPLPARAHPKPQKKEAKK